MAKCKVYCTNDRHGFLEFYVTDNNQDIFLFEQKFRTKVRDYYSKGVYISDAIDRSKAKMDEGLARVMRKLPSYLKYTEKEYGITIFSKNNRTSLSVA